MANNFNQKIADVISEEHENNKGIYGTIRLKFAIQKKYDLILNHKLIRRYKHILNIVTLKRTKKGLSVSRAKEKNLVNKAQYIIECNFNSDIPNQKYSSDVSYIKCKDGTLYLSAIKDYFNTEIVSFSTSNYNDVNLIKDSSVNFFLEVRLLINNGIKYDYSIIYIVSMQI